MVTVQTWMKPDESVQAALSWRSMHFFSTVGMVLGILFLPLSWKDFVVFLTLIPIAFGLNYLFYLTLTLLAPATKKDSLLWFLPIMFILVTLCAVIIFAFSTYRYGAYLTLAIMGGIAIDVAIKALSRKGSENP